MGTHFKGNQREKISLDIYIKLVRAAESLASRVHRHLGVELTISQFGVLEALFHLGPLNQRQIGSKLLKSGGNITMVIDNLEKRALVERRRDQEDRRFVTVHLTEAGHALIEEIFPRHVKLIEAEMAGISQQDLEAAQGLLRRLGKGEAGEA